MNIAETAAQLQTIQQAMILIHQSPDGDCIGSGYALAALLRQMGCHAVVRCSDPIPERYAFLTVEETLLSFFRSMSQTANCSATWTNPMADELPLRLTTTSCTAPLQRNAVCIQKQPLPVKSSMRLQRNCL